MIAVAGEVGAEDNAAKSRSKGVPVAEDVRAEMVANVIRVEVAVGDSVSVADTLVVLESMKMEIPVHPEAGGTVTRIAVTEGDVVQEGDLLVVLA